MHIFSHPLAQTHISKSESLNQNFYFRWMGYGFARNLFDRFTGLIPGSQQLREGSGDYPWTAPRPCFSP
jgi:hypothetical protein